MNVQRVDYLICPTSPLGRATLNPWGEMVCLLGQGVEMRPTALYRRLRGNWNIEHKKFDYKGDNMDFKCLEIGNEAKSFLTDL